ncbi:hypothetical protein OVA10_03475 [Lelliottia sp. SL45]|uniref:hypothetical protein n=1 Tax=Lelliottia sp. SL45 TaxID=2994665 RepID=UPI0022732623|nr:hypothetical protein [Lelliottia sp. SL45]MCY1697149.1 hypothetical protein [Lelliottia sp. SL45]
MARRRTLSLITAGVQKNGKPVDLNTLRQVVKNHNEQSRAPISAGHPEKDADKVKALGRVSYPRIEGDELVVELVYTPELEALEDSGEFEGFSAGIYPRPDNGEYYLHHVAVLGQLPPAADIKTRDVVNLSVSTPEEMITLSATVKSELYMPMNKEDKDALLGEIGTLIDSKLKGLKPAGDKGTKTPTGPGGDDKTVTDPKVTAMEQQLTAMQENTKTDRIAQITELADQKGLSDDEKKPVLAMLNARSAIELCDNSEGGIFASTKAMLSARPDKAESTTRGALFDPLEFSDHKGNTVKVDDPSLLALKTGF